MKKIFAAIFAALTITFAASAQTDYNDTEQPTLGEANDELNELQLKQKYKQIWRKGRYLDLGYSIAQIGNDYEPVSKGKFGFFLRKGTSYLFPGKPLWGLVKVGFDINWFDLSVAKYKSANWGDNTTGWGSIGNSGKDDNDYDSDDEDFGFDADGLMDKLNSLGRWNIMVGAIGIGPNITVAPFSMFNNAARFLKASIYFHYQPTFGVYLVSEDGELEASYSYCHMFQFGGKIQWKAIGLGIEGHWGHGKFKQIGFGDMFDDDEEGDKSEFFGPEASSSSDKLTRRFANTRIYLTFSF